MAMGSPVNKIILAMRGMGDLLPVIVVIDWVRSKDLLSKWLVLEVSRSMVLVCLRVDWLASW